jgi:hypothetical protein
MHRWTGLLGNKFQLFWLSMFELFCDYCFESHMCITNTFARDKNLEYLNVKDNCEGSES